MKIKRTLTAVMLAAGVLFGGTATASATSDYPPSGPVVEITGQLVPSATVQAVVRGCVVGETLRTQLASMSVVESTCERTGSTGFASVTSLGGVSRFELALPASPGAVTGEVELLDSGDRLSFLLDVRAQETEVITFESTSGGLPGWPFLMLAGLVALLVLLVVSKRREQQPIP